MTEVQTQTPVTWEVLNALPVAPAITEVKETKVKKPKGKKAKAKPVTRKKANAPEGN